MRIAAAAGLFVALGAPLLAQSSGNYLQRAFGNVGADQPLLGAQAPRFELLIASRDVQIQRTGGSDAVQLTVGDIPLRLDLRRRREDGIDIYTLRHAPGSEVRAEQVRFTFTFPETYNESMTFDTGALQGQPLFLPDGKVPDNQFTNWGSLFYNREANLAVGTELKGSEPSRHARRGHNRFTRSTSLQLVTTTGHPEMEITVFAYRPADERFWWAEWYQHRSRAKDTGIPTNFFPILAPRDISWQPGEKQTIFVVPAPADAGRKMELALIDDIHKKLVTRIPFEAKLPVTHVPVTVGDWPSTLLRAVVAAPGDTGDPAQLDLNRKLTNVIVRPRSAKSPVLFIAPTDMWWAYSTNGGHDYHGWRTGYDGSVGYSPTVMSSRQHRLNNFFYSLYERFSDIYHLRYLDELSRQEGFTVDYATQRDVALGRVRLGDYRVVLVGNHSEFTTRESHRRFSEYMANGGAVFIHGGDSFAVIVEYLPSLEEPRYIWQRGHVWTHLSDQPTSFASPQLLPPDASADAPISNPSPGSALDYLNVFHTTVGYWIPGSKAVIANTAHPITRGLNVPLGTPVAGPWGGEVDFAFEPKAWNILVRSDRAAPEDREFGVDAYDPTPLHRVGLAIHKNLRLAMVCGENFPHILKDPNNKLYRDLYRRTLRYLLDSASAPHAEVAIPEAQQDSLTIQLPTRANVGAIRYRLPEFVDYSAPDWHKKPAPYAHYVVQGSVDGQTWFTLADRTHGPWRGAQTDYFPSAAVRYLRFDGTFSNGKPFEVRGVRVYQ